MNNTKQHRYYDMDWLRIIGMLMVFIFHCARYFDHDGWHVKNFETGSGWSVMTAIISQWLMPLFFLISGQSTIYALRKRSNFKFISERFFRLWIPLTFGTLVVIVPLQVWIENVSFRGFTGNFFQFMPEYFKGWYGFGGNFAWMGLHLWYLEVLFIFSLIFLPLFRLWMRSSLNTKGLFQKLVSAPFGVYIPVIPILIVEVLVRPYPDSWGMDEFGGWSVFTYMIFFLLGMIFTDNDNLIDQLRKQRWIFVGIALILTMGRYILIQLEFPFPGITWSMLRSLNSWSWLMAMMALCRQYLSFKHSFLKYANQAVLPFYILHQTFIVGLGFLIVDWQIGSLLKYLILMVISFISIMLTYEFVIKRVKFLRFLMGMK